MTDRFVLAIDLGTTGLKVGLVSTTGKIIWTADAQLATTFLPHGGAEQDADEWWRLITDSARAGIASGAVDPKSIVAVSTTGQWASTVPVDERGVPVGPCILWMDTRGGRHVRQRIGGKVSGYKAKAIATWIRRTGGAPSTAGADPIGHMLHLAIDQPDIANAARWYLEPVDYIGTRFTGEATATHASMTGAWLTDNRDLGNLNYDHKLLELAGVDASKLPPLRTTASIMGKVLDEVANDLGLPHGVLVVAGTPDLHSASVGAGTVLDYQTHMAISTTTWISCPVPFKKTDVGSQIASVPGAGPDGYLVANNHDTSGACLQWLRDKVIAPDDGLSDGLQGGARPDFGALMDLAAKVPPGSGGVIFTPWLTGERSPIDDKTARRFPQRQHRDRSRRAHARCARRRRLQRALVARGRREVREATARSDPRVRWRRAVRPVVPDPRRRDGSHGRPPRRSDAHRPARRRVARGHRFGRRRPSKGARPRTGGRNVHSESRDACRLRTPLRGVHAALQDPEGHVPPTQPSTETQALATRER